MEAKALQATARDLYDLDFFEWTVQNAELLRAGRFDQADIERIAEELEDMGKRERRELLSRLQVLFTHLLKWQFQPEHQSGSWRSTINVQRRELEKLLDEMPSQRNALLTELSKVYRWACEDAVEEMRLLRDPFTEVCPFTLEQILDGRFFPS